MRKKTLLIALIFFTLLTTFSLWKMSQLTLWGHTSLVYLLGLWGTVNTIVALLGKYTKSDLKVLGYALIGSLLLTAGFPPYPLIGACFFGFSFFFYHRKRSKDLKHSKRRYNWQIFSALWLWNILCTFWVENTLFTAGVLANVLNGLLMLIPFVLYNRWEKNIPKKWLKYACFISLWIAYEFLHLNWEISWPWLVLGHQFAHLPEIIQWYEYTGVLGGTLWILVLSALLYEFFLSETRSKFQLLRIAIFLITPIIISVIIFNRYEIKGSSSEVLVIQPNFNPHFEKRSLTPGEQLRIISEMIESSITDSTTFILLPESSLKQIDKRRIEKSAAYQKIRAILDKYPNAALMGGASMQENWGDTPPKNKNNLRKHVRDNGEIIYWKSYNSALFVSKDEEIDYYFKSKFVPGAEFVPYPKIFFFVEAFANAFDATLEGMGTQDNRISFEKNGHRMAPVICYESVFGRYSSKYVTHGKAQALGIITIDGWWDNTAGHKQFLHLASLRAIELRKDIARSAVTGISGFIDQRGTIKSRTEYETKAAVRGEVYFNDFVSFYAVWGDIIGRLSIFMIIICFLHSIRIKFKL